jgi:4-hydroxy-3-polyprenylbenzoate decarboxylase
MAQIRANGIQLEYDVAGPEDGPPLLMIMGFGSQMTSWPVAFRDALAAAGLRVVRFDNRDVGLSQRFAGTPTARDVAKAVAEGRTPDVPYVLSDMAADAAGLLEALGIESAHIAGASMGGMIAQLVALNHPAKARSLVSIFSTTGDPSLPRSTPEAQAALCALADRVHPVADLGAAIASGSFPVAGMIVAPCSMRSLAAIAQGLDDSLLTRAAGVQLKERRPLVLLAREAPLTLAHLRNMTSVTGMGAIVLPPVPAFYLRPQTTAEITAQIAARAVDLLRLGPPLARAWTPDDKGNAT